MTPGTMIKLLLKYASTSAAVLAALYAVLLGLPTTSSFQAHVVYLHKIQMTWFKDLDAPEIFGFLHNQATPFSIKSSATGEALYAWHILPLELYRKHETALLAEPASFVLDITTRLAFKLRDDPDARLVLHMHGAGGTVGSGYRPPNYRALSAGSPEKIHVVTFDYRGFGRSRGTPSALLLSRMFSSDRPQSPWSFQSISPCLSSQAYWFGHITCSPRGVRYLSASMPI
jgi:abhydrolase domain-containing protein 12